MQMSGMRACYQIPECSISYTKTMQGERNSKTEKRSFFRLDIAEPKLVLYCQSLLTEQNLTLIASPLMTSSDMYVTNTQIIFINKKNRHIKKYNRKPIHYL